MNRCHLAMAVRALSASGVVAYPTEAVFGLGCDPLDPEAVARLLALKRRRPDKGMILIGAALSQVAPYFEDSDGRLVAAIGHTWPGPVTWLLPAAPHVPSWLTGGEARVAVRVTAHPGAAALCRAFGAALVSTSANLSGGPPARSPLAVRARFRNEVDYVVPGAVGGDPRPTEIRDAVTGRILRPGPRCGNEP